MSYVFIGFDSPKFAKVTSVPNATSNSNVTSTPSVEDSSLSGFADRRQARDNERGVERRQFGNSYRDLSEAGRELAEAIDAYKLQHRRRYITTDEMLQVILALGYRLDS